MVVAVTLAEGAEGEDGLATPDAPARACALHPHGDQGLVGGLDHAGADGELPLLETGVVQSAAVSGLLVQCEGRSQLSSIKPYVPSAGHFVEERSRDPL